MSYGSGFLKLMRSSDALETMIKKGFHEEFILLTVMALRARRTPCPITKLEIGECHLGDIGEYNLTDRKYRTAKKNLEMWQIATFKATKAGTVGKLIDSSIYDINVNTSDEQSDERPTNDRRTGDEQTDDKQECFKNVKNEKNDIAPVAPAPQKTNLDYKSWPSLPSEKILKEWTELRRSKKAKISQTVIDKLGKELVLASQLGYSVDQCFEMIIYKSWTGFEAAWMQNTNVIPIKQPTSQQIGGYQIKPFPTVAQQ